MPDVFKSTPDRRPKVTQHKHIPNKEELAAYGHTRNRLAAYCYYPDHVNFVGADSEEKIVLLLRRHAITNIPESAPVNFSTVGLIFWYLISFAYIFEQFLSWFFNVYIVTDERVFDVDFLNLVYREITDANIDQIQDVTVRVGSVIRTVFDYGDIIIQTAAQIPQIEFEAVPHPDRVAQVLRELRVEEETEKLEGRVR